MGMLPDQALSLINRAIEGSNAALSLSFSKKLLEEGLHESVIQRMEDEYFFSPLKGNVVFASCNDNWAFTLDNFTELLAKTMGGANPAKVKQFLWGEYFLNPKDKKIVKKPVNNMHPNIFTQFSLKNIHAVYSAVKLEKDSEKVKKISKVLGVELPDNFDKKMESDPQLIVSVISS
jgi:ribosome assembly protein 1